MCWKGRREREGVELLVSVSYGGYVLLLTGSYYITYASLLICTLHVTLFCNQLLHFGCAEGCECCVLAFSKSDFTQLKCLTK